MSSRRRKSGAPSQMWLLTFADLVSLMITFFVMLYAMKSVDVNHWKSVKGALTGALSFADAKEAVPQEDNTVERMDLLEADPLDYISNLFAQRLSHIPALSGATIKRDRQHDTLTIALPSALLFPSGSAVMSPGGSEAIDKLGDLLRNLDNRIVVEGHTDPVPLSGSVLPTNWELSMMRAISVLEKLRSVGVSSPMTARGLGESRFSEVEPNAPQALRYIKARRVDIVIRGDKGQEAE